MKENIPLNFRVNPAPRMPGTTSRAAVIAGSKCSGVNGISAGAIGSLLEVEDVARFHKQGFVAI